MIPESYKISTFAWFTATGQGAQVSANAPGDSMSVSNPSYTATAIDLPVVVSVARDDDSTNKYNSSWKSLELVHWYDEAAIATASEGAVAAGLNSGYWSNAQHTFLEHKSTAKGDGYAFYATYTISLTVDSSVYNFRQAEGEGDNDCYKSPADGSIWTAAQIAEKFDTDNELVTVKVEAKDTSNGDAATRAMIFSLGTGAVSVDEGASTKTFEGTLDNLYQGSAIKTLTWKFGLYVEGYSAGNSGIDPNNTSVNGNFKVSVLHRNA